MNITLYHYVHCPFCVRVRMGLGFLQKPFQSVVLPYDDEATPVKLTGTKMLPIAVVDGRPVNESLDILELADGDRVLRISNYKSSGYKALEEDLNRLGSLIHSLAMPYWMHTPEFTESSRAYFQKKKEEKRGPFKELVRNQKSFIESLSGELTKLETRLKPFLDSSEFRIEDILVASHLWGLYVVPEFQFTPIVHSYLQAVKEKCNFNYHKDFWT